MPKLSKFAISLQYLKKKVSHEVVFLHADKYESLIQIDTLILMGMAKHSQSSQNNKFAKCSCLANQIAGFLNQLYL